LIVLSGALSSLSPQLKIILAIILVAFIAVMAFVRIRARRLRDSRSKLASENRADAVAVRVGQSTAARVEQRAAPPMPIDKKGRRLRVVDLMQSFGERDALKHVSFDVLGGVIVGLVGRNGAGKTTTMRAIMGILQPNRGEVTWDDHVVSAADRLHFGYMPEERGLYPQMAVEAQLAYFAELHGMDADRAGAAAMQWIDVLGLSGREQERVVALSHGNQQRVQLAAALVHDPDVLVLDEPFAGLDPSAVDSLSDILRAQAARGVAVLFSSHQLDLVEELCDRSVILEEGRVLVEGSLDELRSAFPQRLRVKVAGTQDWSKNLPHTTVMQANGEGIVLGLKDGADPQAILHAAEAAGPVEHFGFEKASLAEIYRELVTR
jgi:ABC-2 type transport system ATP-binding protein